jgi:hypothetical protein
MTAQKDGQFAAFDRRHADAKENAGERNWPDLLSS